MDLLHFIDLFDDLDEEYRNSLLIQHCRGDDKDPSRRLILQKCLREKYASKLKEICKDNQSKNFYARILYRKLTPAKFRDIEMCINWNMFEKNGQCANDALALVTREEFPEIGKLKIFAETSVILCQFLLW